MKEISDTARREISSSRVYDAPRHLVWMAWSGPNHLGEWWGPNGFTTTTKVFELRAGGKWLFTMHGPDGTDYRNDITFTAIVEPELIEYEHGPSPVFHTKVTFEEVAPNKTKLTMTALFPTIEERDRTVEKFNAVEGLHQTLGRLGAYLEEFTK